MDCSDFVARFTDYRDGSAPPGDLGAMEEHVARCPSCRRYQSVLEHGASVLRSLPEPELREDFEPRLQHRLYHVADERSVSDQPTSGTSALTVLGIAVLLTAVAWAPVLSRDSAVVELEPIVVDRAPVQLRLVPAASPQPRQVDDQRSGRLEPGLWDDTRLFDYSPLRRRYEAEARSRQVGLDPAR